MADSRRQLAAMLRKNWLLKIRHPFTTLAEILLPTIVMLMLIAVRTQVDTTIHPVQAYIRKDMLVEVGKSKISPSFDALLEVLYASHEHLAFVPDTNETRFMVDVLSWKFPLLKVVGLACSIMEECCCMKISWWLGNNGRANGSYVGANGLCVLVLWTA